MVGAECGLCNKKITAGERQYFMCQRCTMPLHTECVDRHDTGVCEANSELTSFEIIDVSIAEALQDKVNKINQVNALIQESTAALEAVNRKMEGHAETPKLLGEEAKLHEKKLKKFRTEKGAFEALVFVEMNDMSEEMRRYSFVDEGDEEGGKDGKGSFAKGIKDKVKLVLS